MNPPPQIHEEGRDQRTEISIVQPDLFTPRPVADPDRAAVALFATLLQERGWVTAAELLPAFGRPVNEDSKRWLRKLRKQSGGHIVGGPGMPGYRLVKGMSAEDYAHWRNTMRSQTREMLRAVLQADKVFFGGMIQVEVPA